MNIFSKVRSLGANVKFELDLSYYGRKSDLEKSIGIIDKSELAYIRLIKLIWNLI